jgi:pilus assembly protein CpaC
MAFRARKTGLNIAALMGGACLLWAPASDAQMPPLPQSAQSKQLGDGTGLRLIVSEQHVVLASRVRRIAVGDPSVADVLQVKGGVLILGKKPGTTVVSIWQDGMPEIRQVVQVRSALSDAVLPPTAQINMSGNSALVTGSFATAENHDAALRIAKNSLGGPDTPGGSGGGPGGGGGGGSGNNGSSAITIAMGDSGSGGANGGMTVSGGNDNNSTNVIDRSVVTAGGSGGVVQVDVKIVEFSKSVLKEAGFNLFSTRSNGFGFGTFAPTSLSSYSPTSSSLSFGSTVGTAMSSAFNLVAGPFGNGLFANLSVLETNGLARVLAEPTLVALSGQSASFLSGGELPIPQSGGLGTTTIQFKPFGIGLTVTPTVLGPDRIALKVAPEASDIDYAHALTISGVSIPAITTRRADTTVELGDGESFVIGGLVSRSTTSSVNKVPLLGDLPIIGAFFKSLNYTQDDRELVIVVTPHVVKPIARGVALPLPADGSDDSHRSVWGTFVGGFAARPVVPGFSR